MAKLKKSRHCAHERHLNTGQAAHSGLSLNTRHKNKDSLIGHYHHLSNPCSLPPILSGQCTALATPGARSREHFAFV